MFPFCWFPLCVEDIFWTVGWNSSIEAGVLKRESIKCHVTLLLIICICWCVLFPQNEESSTHEKVDFKLHFTCTSYLITTPCYRLVYCFCLEHRPYHITIHIIKVEKLHTENVYTHYRLVRMVFPLGTMNVLITFYGNMPISNCFR